MASLHATHLYGRHLVLEYAEQERSVEAMREKMRVQVDSAAAAQEAAEANRLKKRRGKGGDDLDDDPVGRLRL